MSQVCYNADDLTNIYDLIRWSNEQQIYDLIRLSLFNLNALNETWDN